MNTGLTPSVWHVHYEFVRVMWKACLVTFGPGVPEVTKSSPQQLDFSLAGAKELQKAA